MRVGCNEALSKAKTLSKGMLRPKKHSWFLMTTYFFINGVNLE